MIFLSTIGKRAMHPTRCLSSHTMSRVLTLCNPLGREANWFAIDRQERTGQEYRITRLGRSWVKGASSLLLCVTATIETVAYAIFALIATPLRVITSSAHRRAVKLLESSIYSVLWSLCNLFPSRFSQEMERATDESFHRLFLRNYLRRPANERSKLVNWMPLVMLIPTHTLLLYAGAAGLRQGALLAIAALSFKVFMTSAYPCRREDAARVSSWALAHRREQHSDLADLPAPDSLWCDLRLTLPSSRDLSLRLMITTPTEELRLPPINRPLYRGSWLDALRVERVNEWLVSPLEHRANIKAMEMTPTRFIDCCLRDERIDAKSRADIVETQPESFEFIPYRLSYLYVCGLHKKAPLPECLNPVRSKIHQLRKRYSKLSKEQTDYLEATACSYARLEQAKDEKDHDAHEVVKALLGICHSIVQGNDPFSKWVASGVSLYQFVAYQFVYSYLCGSCNDLSLHLPEGESRDKLIRLKERYKGRGDRLLEQAASSQVYFKLNQGSQELRELKDLIDLVIKHYPQFYREREQRGQ